MQTQGPESQKVRRRWLAFSIFVAAACVAAQAPKLITNDFPRLNWQPTQIIPGAQYVGTEVCASCHRDRARTQLETPMGQALELVSRTPILQSHPHLTFHLGPYSYSIERQGARSIYSVTNGSSTVAEPIDYAFGQGQAGQTYLFRRNGAFYESHVSFFNDVQGLDITIGYKRTVPNTLEEAAGRAISSEEARMCFGCHSTTAVEKGRLMLDHLAPGVTCEGCHGPGGEHLRAVQSGAKQPYIFNPGRLNAGDVADFCGSCHRTGVQVATAHIQGINTVRFQPYRLSNSRCFDPDDSRISCLACHDPHQNLRQDTAFYDARCTACHQVGSHRAATTPHDSHRMLLVMRSPSVEPQPRTCPVAVRNCTSCHMPKYGLPGGHFKFTDHYIRVVRAGEAYPD